MSSVTTKLSNTADIASSEAQALVADIRKALGNMKSLAVDYERDGKSDKARAHERSPIFNPHLTSPINP
ncbi:E3 SUMO-protein ligase MMS21 isoform X2 [Panicum miliaceum]|uniref:E3 SUMO-protein ligase MMS21 isoform X2 n=1 Tax=Panicum miliaceum TaxID=4540 RepID=A0A3L6SX08_PANMI|nr:E3 SUMO-protein ligase MMS21 isoform X2 [Panicum miliaceum]